jgi:hypothetical protein
LKRLFALDWLASWQAARASILEKLSKDFFFQKIMRIFWKFSAAIFTGRELLERLKTPT